MGIDFDQVMDIDFDQGHLSRNIEEIDWESVYPEIGELSSSPIFYLMRVTYNYKKNIRRLLLDFDLTQTQLVLLGSLMMYTRGGKVVTQIDLADHLKADKMMVSKVLRTLEKKGFIIRENHPEDGRAKSLVVTEKGLKIIEATLKVVTKFNEEFFSVLDNQDEFVRQLKKLQ